FLVLLSSADPRDLPSFPTRRSSDLRIEGTPVLAPGASRMRRSTAARLDPDSGSLSELDLTAGSTLIVSFDDDSEDRRTTYSGERSEEHTSELQSRENLVCRLLLEKK